MKKKPLICCQRNHIVKTRFLNVKNEMICVPGCRTFGGGGTNPARKSRKVGNDHYCCYEINIDEIITN